MTTSGPRFSNFLRWSMEQHSMLIYQAALTSYTDHAQILKEFFAFVQVFTPGIFSKQVQISESQLW